MVDFVIPAGTQPRDVASCFAGWASMRNEPSVRFVLPAESLHAWTIALLGAMAADRHLRGLENVVAPSNETTVRGLLAKSAIEWPRATTMKSSVGFLELLQPINDLKAARTMADQVGDAMEAVTPSTSPSVARMTRFVFEELGANIVQHSGRPETGYGFAAIEPDKRQLELGFADAGAGFRASLQRNPELEGRIDDDAEALQLALTPRITGTSTPRTNMGIGLKALTDFSDLLAGELFIASGSAMLRRGTAAGQRTNVIHSIPPWPGTWISFRSFIG